MNRLGGWWKHAVAICAVVAVVGSYAALHSPGGINVNISYDKAKFSSTSFGANKDVVIFNDTPYKNSCGVLICGIFGEVAAYDNGHVPRRSASRDCGGVGAVHNNWKLGHIVVLVRSSADGELALHGGSLAGVYKVYVQPVAAAGYGARRDVVKLNVRPSLSLADFSRHGDGVLRSSVSLPSEKESCKKENCAYANKPSLNISVVTHFLRSIVNGSRGVVHSLLGDQVINLVLVGFGFAALSGLGGGLILDNVNRERNRKRLGWLLLLSCLPLFIVSFLLGLP